MKTAIPLWEVPAVPVAGSEARFPVRRIYCVGRNYAEHAREMGADPTREPPFFFMKPAEAIVTSGRMAYPPMTADLQHEVELVVALGRGGRDISAAGALECVFGYAVGLDMTRRDVQAELKAKGRSWEMGKAFDASAPISAVVPATRIGHPDRGAIGLKVNSQSRQHGDLADMIWPVADIIANLSAYVTLLPGDLVFTGTPAGVGRVERGDRLEGEIEGVGVLSVAIA
ncbi:MAG: fumarylacetoacetate hydrolase family protein [Rhodocyclaceae bacterium]|jgi:fumarylpyruvate hydrolase|nr:Fumarylpyruvate hydrolase [Rhodocyclaceae bacterium]MBZ0142618.1 fumarylacetoacetate hydrolase family protein [Rhodocyclaceae bacterium]MCC6878967.1 fumarylacetoacetate hydrolase family protein [Rhodocyclaceae bacterium]MCL4681665.1 fumarylacetoacetate hydrolase family protein [Rhodocyclaceae bacterium]